MFQMIPSEAHYKQLTRDMINRKEYPYLLAEELKSLQEQPLCKAGNTTYTGYVLSQFDADAINRFTHELNRERCKVTREYLKDRRHQQFCIIAEQVSAEQLAKLESARYKKKLAEESAKGCC